MPKNKSWFRMSKKEDVAEIEIFDEIDAFWGLGPKEFKSRFDEIKDSKSIKLLLNSPGGSVFDGMAIYNILATARDKLEIEVVGLAASIASIIALAGNKLTMAEGSYYMIHKPWTLAMGDGDELRKTADILDKMSGEFVKMYVNKSGLKEDEVEKLMADETWLTASEAVEMGFADATEDYGEIAARVDTAIVAKFKNIPETLAKASNENKITNPRDFEGALRDLGFTKKEAVAIVADGWKAVGRSDSEPASRSDSVGQPLITPAMLIEEIEAQEKVGKID